MGNFTKLIRSGLLLAVIALIQTPASAQLQVAFAPRFSDAVYGDFVTIGNNMLSTTASGNYTGTDGNHNITSVFVDIDADNTTFNSSSANLVDPIPNTNCVFIKKAYLYWAAADFEEANIANEPVWNYNDIKLMLPGSATYTTITADNVVYRGRTTHFVNDPYVCFKDITSLVQGLGSPYGKYQVANVRTKKGDLNPDHTGSNVGTSGGWQVIFVYEGTKDPQGNAILPAKYISVFDGYANVTSSQNNYNITISGFQTPPVGNIQTKIMFGALEGDRDLTGDQFQIRNVANTFVDMTTGSLRPTTNFFDSRITAENTDYINRNPASTNTLGYDIGYFTLSNPGNSIITNSQTSAVFRLTSNQETYGLYMVGFSTDVWAPDLSPMVQVSSPGTVNPGDTISYTFTVKNSGNDDARNVVITRTLPPEVDLVQPVTPLPAGVTYSYNTGTRVLSFFIQNGLVDVGDAAINISYKTVLKDQCYFLETACPANINAQILATYTGVQNPNTQTTLSSNGLTACGLGNDKPNVTTVNSPSAAGWATNAGALNRTVNCNDAPGLAAAEALFPATTKCNFTLNKVTGSFAAIANSCPVIGTYTNTWTFTDKCGRTSPVFTQIITVQDTTKPVFTSQLPANAIVNCNAVPTAPTLTASDNCTTGTVTFNEVRTNGNCVNNYVLSRTWIAKDACNNSISYTQTLTVQDTTRPVFVQSLPVNAVICGNPAPAPTLTATDNCGQATVVFTELIDSVSVPGVKTYTRKWTATDVCNNSTIYTQTITSNAIKVTTQNPVICQGQSVTVGNHTYTTSGTFKDTLQTSKGCDSIVTTNLTVNPVKTTTQSPVICQGQSVTVGNHTYTTSGTFKDTLQTSKGCDSIITTNLTVNPAIATTQNPVVCQGQSVTVGNNIYTSSGTFKDTLQTSKGCDSVVTTNLTVNPAIATTQNPVICQGESVTVGNHIYTSSGTFKDTLQTSKGCDSIITTNLTVNPVKTTTQSPVICQGENVTVGIHTYSSSGTFKDTLQTSKGCDSIVTTNLTVNPVKTTTQSPVICQGESVTVGNHTYTSSGTFKDTLQTSKGCDSIVTTNLTVNSVKTTTQSPVICQGQSVTVGNHTYTTSGTFKDTLQTSKGCDSIVTTNLTVNSVITTTQNPVLCQGQSVTVGNHTYTSSGTFTDTLQTSKGCDSIVTTNLTVNPVKTTTQSPVICQGESVIVGNHIYTSSGTFKDTLQTSKGCDSIVTTNLTVNPVKTTTQSPVICQGETVTVGDHTYTSAGTFKDTLQTSKGCDSIVTTNLIVNPVKTTTQSPVICQDESVTVGNHNYTSSGTFTDTLQTSKGCDSVVTTNLTVNPVKTTTLNPVICQGGHVTVGNHTYSTTGIFKDTLQTSKGCDSIITTNLTVNPNTQFIQAPHICQGESITVGTIIHNQSGIYIDTIRNSKGCDSIVFTKLTVDSVKTVTQNLQICQGESITVGSHTYSTTGTFTDTLQTNRSCDSIITTHLTVNPLKATTQNPVICQGESVTVGNHIYTSSGTFTDTLQTSKGCDSSVTTHLTVNPVKTTTQNPVICQGASVIVGNHNYTSSGTFSDTLQTSKGCDSIVTTNLTVNPVKTSTQDPVICPGETVTIGNHTHSSAGTFKDTLQTSKGCDSIVTTNLTVNPVKTSTQNPVLCQGQSVTVGNHTYNSSGTFTDTLQTSQGCDSIVTTNLMVNPVKTSTQDPVICQGESVTVGNHTYTSSGTFTDILQTSKGCDSTVTTNLTVNPVKATTQNPVICQGGSVTVGNHTYTSSGTFTDILQTSKGCDSTVTTNLTVNPVKTTTQNRVICQGETVTVGNHTYSSSGTFTDTLRTSKGCDSIVTTNISVDPFKTTTQDPVICQGESATVGNHIYASSGTFIDTLQTSKGCDSIVTTNLTVNPVKSTSQSPVICQGTSIIVGNHTYTLSGTFTDTLQTSKGCDSIVTTNLTVNPVKTITQNPVICQGASITVGNHTYTSSGTFTDTLQTSKGCDSIITTNLTVNPVISNTQNHALCQGESVTVGNHIYNSAGTFHDTLQTRNGCDSIIITIITINPVKTTTQNPVICQGESITVGNHNYTSSGIFIDTLQTISGCDSIITTSLTVNPVKRTAQSLVICQGENVTVGNAVHSQTGNYIDTLNTSSGCDSIVSTNLTVNPVKATSQSHVICGGESISVGNIIHNQTGIYRDTLQTSKGCDSIITTDLTVNPVKMITQSFIICQGETVIVGNNIHSQTGTYVDTLQTSLGCDSIVTTNINVNAVKTTAQSFVLCSRESLTVGNIVHNQTGIYIDTLQTISGCDSIVTTDLFVRDANETRQSFVVCDGESILVGSILHNLTGNYIDTLQSFTGCDSVCMTNLLVNDRHAVSQSFSLCNGSSILVGNIIHDQTGIYIDTLKNIRGCDSIITTDLLIKPVNMVDVRAFICIDDTGSGSFVTVGNQTFSIPGSYQVTLQNVSGCDSVINLDLIGRLCVTQPGLIDTIRDTVSVRMMDTVCLGLMPSFDATVTACDGSTSGTEVHGTWTISTTLPHCLLYHADSILGSDILCLVACDSVGIIYVCDSSIVIITVIDSLPVAEDECVETDKDTPIPISVLRNDRDPDFDRLYIDGIVQQPLFGTAQIDPVTQTITYTPNKNFCGADTFYYEVCDHVSGCDVGKVCINVRCKCQLPQVITPNNDGFNDVLMIPCINNVNNSHIVVWNRWGLLVFENDNYKNDWDGKYNGDYLPPGTYWYAVDFKDPETQEQINEANYLMIIR
ncbi:MAG: hypothetical protein JWN78_3084 [Bacteroidota bacterium]|nr:hypothetical protein [Bacteroidota bacterium]